MLEILNITKALADESRVRALMMLADGELCVCQMVELLGLAPSTVSKHMSILRQAGLVETRKDGRWQYYRLAEREKTAGCEILQWLKHHLAKDAGVVKDARRLRKIQKMDMDKLSECYRS